MNGQIVKSKTIIDLMKKILFSNDALYNQILIYIVSDVSNSKYVFAWTCLDKTVQYSVPISLIHFLISFSNSLLPLTKHFRSKMGQDSTSISKK